MEVWARARAQRVSVVVFVAGFPCRNLSAVNQTRGGLEAGQSSLFYEALKLLKELRATQPGDIGLRSVLENVQSMAQTEAEKILQKLREVDGAFEVVGICASFACWCRRPRWFWTNWWVPGSGGPFGGDRDICGQIAACRAWEQC